MYFSSDNWAGAHPVISRRLHEAADGFASAYGTSDLDRKVADRFNEIFEREVEVFFVGTGTAANSLALASVAKAGGLTFCHHEAHIHTDECGAPGFFAHGSRLYPVAGSNARIDPAALAAAIARFPDGGVHFGQAAAVSITQATEFGTVYSLAEIDAVKEVARSRGLPLHMDGARFANALAALGATPAEMTWKRGVDILSFGGTKNGCWMAEALVFFDREHAREMPYLRKRSAQLFSKSRFIAAQFDAYLEDGLWLQLAAHANAMADRLREGLSRSTRSRNAWETSANEVFAVMPKVLMDEAFAAGARFYDWPVPADQPSLAGPDEVLVRLVTSYATSTAELDALLGIIG
ncbi:threonine aldolase family protein [Gellertiella hungarica]|uniref:L-threonine aldolase n=1 Tax=Gellertiella hungarica TaxID=1572859 RepID=A0A7W6J1L1_9HYPH|nr:low specificity L-threonine aldolase [Gellertiella hungarica]MBB4063094.1 threonine aldolase [Gellertiella hungarica]